MEHLFIGYITLVLVRFCWWAFRDELKDRARRGADKNNSIRDYQLYSRPLTAVARRSRLTRHDRG